MTVVLKAFEDRTIYTGYYDISENTTPLNLVLLTSANSSTVGSFSIETTTFVITGSFSKIYPSGTSLASIYSDGSLRSIVDTKEYTNGTLVEHRTDS